MFQTNWHPEVDSVSIEANNIQKMLTLPECCPVCVMTSLPAEEDGATAGTDAVGGPATTLVVTTPVGLGVGFTAGCS